MQRPWTWLAVAALAGGAALVGGAALWGTTGGGSDASIPSPAPIGKRTVGCGREGTGNAPAQTVARASEFLCRRNVGLRDGARKTRRRIPRPLALYLCRLRFGLTE